MKNALKLASTLLGKVSQVLSTSNLFHFLRQKLSDAELTFRLNATEGEKLAQDFAFNNYRLPSVVAHSRRYLRPALC